MRRQVLTPILAHGRTWPWRCWYEYRFTIDVFTPETFPLVRLVEYLGDLAILLGHPDEVHFMRVDPGSAQLISLIDPPAQPKIRERLTAVRHGGGPVDARKAFRNIDERLASDNASAKIAEDIGELLDFPGRNRQPPPTFGPFNEPGTLDGVIIAVGGRGDPVPIHLQDGATIHNCLASRELARRLAQHLFVDPVRVSGVGRWLRNEDGEWQLRTFRIADFNLLDDTPLDEVVERLREEHRRSDWAAMDDPISEMEDLRKGNGGF